MNLDITIHKGRKDRPVVIFIHGLGVDKNFWLDPLNTKIFAKNIPLKVFTATKPHPCKAIKGIRITLGDYHTDITNLWSALKNEGFNLVCWSQQRPVGPISLAVEELVRIMERTKEPYPRNPVAFIGHSRGGLIARKFMEQSGAEVRALITLSTPHEGSSIARIGRYLEPFSNMLKKVVPEKERNIVSKTVKYVSNSLEGRGWRELMPESVFFRELRYSCRKSTAYVSLGGTQPRLLTLYMWKRKGEKMHANPLLSVPDSLIKVLPPALTVNEIIPGKGDGLVTARSSVLPWASEHHDLKANHISIVWHRKTVDIVLRTLGKI
jgi:pimeloyl-ACP methyl ester carboxylesterase